MSMRERMLAVIRHEPHDRVPFVTYDGIVGPREEVWGALGRENVPQGAWRASFPDIVRAIGDFGAPR